MIPADFVGIMITDRGRSCDAQALAASTSKSVRLTFCGRLPRSWRRRPAETGDFEVQLQKTLALWPAHWQGQVPYFKVEAEALEAEVPYQLRNRWLRDPENQRLPNELGWYHHLGNLLRFLADRRIEPTNDRAERARRSAVIARKVSHCSKSGGEADAFAEFTSVIRTRMKGGVESVVDALSKRFRPIQPDQVPDLILSLG